jgi:hypothetical protein
VWVQEVRFTATDDLDALLADAGRFLQAQPGFLGREVCRNGDDWLGLLRWVDRDHADAATDAWQATPLAARMDRHATAGTMRTWTRVHTDAARHLEPTWNAGRDFVMRGLQGPVDMLNLLRFHEVADYTGFDALAPQEPVSGARAYALYSRLTLPFLHAAGGSVVYAGQGGPGLIGPQSSGWDRVLIVRHTSAEAFLSFARDPAYLAGLGHRSAALLDSRLLPMQPL